MMRLLLLLVVAMGLRGTAALGAKPLPPRAMARIGDHRFFHGPYRIDSAVLSPDGSRIASVANNYNLGVGEKVFILWDAVTGERLRELRGPLVPCRDVSFSPDGKRLAGIYYTSDKKFHIAVWEVESEKLLRCFGNFDHAKCLHFSADGKQLYFSEWDGPVCAWDASNGKLLRSWNPPLETQPTGSDDPKCGLLGVLSPDGKIIAWEMGFSGKNLLRKIPTHLRFHDAATDKLLYQKKITCHHGRFLQSFPFSSDSRYFADELHLDKLTVWEAATGKEVVVLNVPRLYKFTLSPDGRRAAIGGLPHLWDLSTRKPTHDLYVGDPEGFSADGKTLLLASHSTLVLFDTATGKERHPAGHRTPVTPRFSRDGRMLFTSGIDRRCSWDISSIGKPTLRRQEARHGWEDRCLGHSGDERLFLDCPESRVRVRDTASGRVRHEWKKEGKIVGKGWFSPDAAEVLLYEFKQGQSKEWIPDSFRLCDVKTGRTMGTIPLVNPVGDPVFSPSGRLLAWADHFLAIHLHDAVTGRFIRTLHSTKPLPGKKSRAHLLFSPDGERLIVANELYLLWDPVEEKDQWAVLPLRVIRVADGKEIIRFHANPEKKSKANPISCLAWSPDGRLIAVAEHRSPIVRVIEMARGKVRLEFVGHRHGVHDLAFSPDGKTLASGGDDNVVYLWDVTGVQTPAPAKPTGVTDLEASWKDLAGDDGRRAGRAIAELLRKPEASVAFLQRRLQPAKGLDKNRFARLLADLDSDHFETRQAASRELARLGERVVTALRQALTRRPSLEVRRRIEDLLSKLEPSPPPAETLRQIRAIEVLEHMGTAEARCCLEVLANGAIDARQTWEAKQALKRLAKHNASAKRR